MAEDAPPGRFRAPGEFGPDERLEMAPVFPPEESSSEAAEILRRRGAALLAIEGVQGYGVGQADDGGEAIVVYVLDDSDVARVPRQLESRPVVVVVTGRIGPQDR